MGIGMVIFVTLSTKLPPRSVAQDVKATWTVTNLRNVRVTAIEETENGGRLLTSSRDPVGVHTSTDQGTTWTNFNTNVSTKGIEALASCSSGTHFAGSWGDGIYRMRANESEWQQVNNGLGQLFILSLECGLDAEIMAGTGSQGVYRSQDSGENWEAVNAGLGELVVYDILYHEDRYYAGTTSGVFVKAAGASTWDTYELEGFTVFKLVVFDGELWAGTNQGIYERTVSTDDAWQQVGLLNNTIYSLAIDGDQRVYAGTKEAKVYRYQDNNWEPYTNGLAPMTADSLRALSSNPNRILAGTDDGIWINQIEPLPTPLPVGLTSVGIKSSPQGPIKPSDTITYTIRVENGPYTLTNVILTNTVPTELALITGTVGRGAPGWQPEPNQDGSDLRWTIDELAPNITDTLQYWALLPLPTLTPQPEDLFITKSGPDYAVPGGEITYVLTATNNLTLTLTDIIITDTIPSGFVTTDGGGGTAGPTAPASVVWTMPDAELEAGQPITVTLQGVVRAGTSQIVNNVYSVSAKPKGSDNIFKKIGQDKVTTTIVDNLDNVELADGVIIQPERACVSWVYQASDQLPQSQTQCNPTPTMFLPYFADGRQLSIK